MASSLQYFKKYIKPQKQSQIPTLKYRTNFTNCIQEAFQIRGYERTFDDDWDIIWSQKDGLNQIYQKRLLPEQRVNHFRNYFEMCKKDNLIKNLKKHKKLLEKQNKLNQAKQYNFFPQTYILPSQYFIFADEFKRNQSSNQPNTWIMKPTGKSQGKGIFLVNKLSQLTQWQSTITASSAQPYIIQRYINNPLLIGSKKFDIRIYVLVTSYNPLTVYLYRNGFARFTHARYDQTKITDTQAHLTNVAIQKLSANYDQHIGGKWYLDRLKVYLLSKYGDMAVNQSFYKIQLLIIRTLQAMVRLMATDRPNSFELYGFDVLLDSGLQPWLIEVNGSPSMTANTAKDRRLKLAVLDDVLAVVDRERMLSGEEDQVGGFDLICKRTQHQKTKTTSLLTEKQRFSFLGTMINRQDNYKKLAKINAPRINANLSTEQPLMIKKTNLLLTPTVLKGRQGRRVLSQRGNENRLQIQSQVNSKHYKNQLGVSRRVMPPTLKDGKDFVIKAKNNSFATRRPRPLLNENEQVK